MGRLRLLASMGLGMLVAGPAFAQNPIVHGFAEGPEGCVWTMVDPIAAEIRRYHQTEFCPQRMVFDGENGAILYEEAGWLMLLDIERSETLEFAGLPNQYIEGYGQHDLFLAHHGGPRLALIFAAEEPTYERSDGTVAVDVFGDELDSPETPPGARVGVIALFDLAQEEWPIAARQVAPGYSEETPLNTADAFWKQERAGSISLQTILDGRLSATTATPLVNAPLAPGAADELAEAFAATLQQDSSHGDPVYLATGWETGLVLGLGGWGLDPDPIPPIFPTEDHGRRILPPFNLSLLETGEEPAALTVAVEQGLVLIARADDSGPTLIFDPPSPEAMLIVEGLSRPVWLPYPALWNAIAPPLGP